MTVFDIAKAAREAALELSTAGTSRKDAALRSMADALLAANDDILAANALDVATAHEKGLKESFIERLTLNAARVCAMADGLRDVAALSDPIGEVTSGFTRPNGLSILQKRVPIGVIGIIYESRPNVTADAAGICIKSGNCAILRGGSDAIHSNTAIMRALKRGIAPHLPEAAIALIEDTSRETAKELMRMNHYVDALIPRGGKSLIETVVKEASVPVIQTGTGICHVYVDRDCDIDMARAIAVNAKISRPSTCNSAETLLVDEAIADAFLPGCLCELHDKNVEIRGCERTRAMRDFVLPATEEDYHTEHLALIYNIKVIGGVEAAIAHINSHGTRHSEAIVTRDLSRARRFQNAVDAACVYVNASTRFTDGGEFGFGAEIGISNQKLHARGPMGLKELTTTKYLIEGSGQTR